MSLSLRDFQRPRRENLSLGNVHVQVEDYLRDENGRAYAVQGFNLKDGSEVTIRLADAERFAKLFLNPNEDLALRVKAAEQQIAKRTTMREIGASRGNKAVPVGGVISISSVRPDFETEDLYGRWPNAVVSDPNIELALPAVFEVRSKLVKPPSGREFKTAYINAYFPRQAKSGNDVDRAALDRMLSGKLNDTGAPFRTNLAVTVQLGGETATYAFRPKQIKMGENEYRSTQSVQEALATPLKKLNDAAAAVAVAAKADIPFEQLHFELHERDADKLPALQKLYKQVSDGTVPVTFIPGATMQPSRFTTDALMGQKRNDAGEVSASNTPEQAFLDRGFVSGVLGVRYIAAENGAIIDPIVKAIFSDEALPKKGSEYFIRHDLEAVGHRAFVSTHPELQDSPRLGHMEREPEPDTALDADKPKPSATRRDPSADQDDYTYSDMTPDF